MIDFMIRLSGVTLELSRLLTIRFVPGHAANGTHIGKQVASLIPLWNDGCRDECEMELLRLSYLAKHLKEIEQADNELLLHFRREFRRAGSAASYFGARFEAYIAASLIRSGVSFRKSEAPDFLILDSKLGIECTSARLASANGKLDLDYKIQSAINKKAQSASNRSEVALAIDITNLAYHGGLSKLADTRAATAEALSDTRFGSAVLFTYLFNYELSRYETNYARIDSASITPELNALLNTLYPVTGHEVRRFSIPNEG
ncbi:hypothetical protein [Arenimonas malthae]|uniref:hypothetical protein n=1 Tax=Arenimonas malthae TaxID=354197 RepID=UPI0012EB98E7|nr:hypothetical protein [Arenimonas malthae]